MARRDGIRHAINATPTSAAAISAKVSGSAGPYQVEGASRFATLNIGGSTGTTVCFVVERST